MKRIAGMILVIALVVGMVPLVALANDEAEETAITVHGLVQERDLANFDNVVKADLINFAFAPHELTVEPGTTVVWVNKDRDLHNVHVRVIRDGRYVSLDIGDLYRENQMWAVTFHETGRYNLVCDPHLALGMEGRLIVE